MKIPSVALSGLLAVILAGGGCSSEPETSDADLVGALRDVATGLENQDGPLVCAQLHRNAQEALATVRKAPDCITAVSSGPFDEGLLRTANTIDAGDLEVAGELAVAEGPAADALAELLGMPGLWLSRFEDTWMVQAAEDSTGGTAG